jgi:hypothetical protein
MGLTVYVHLSPTFGNQQVFEGAFGCTNTFTDCAPGNAKSQCPQSKAKANAYHVLNLIKGINYHDLNRATIVPYNTVAPPVPTRGVDMRNALDYQGLTAPTNGKFTP